MPVNPSVSKNDANLIAIITLLVENHLKAVANSSALLALHFGFTTKHVHPINFQLHLVESYRV